jgi:hypothetical protein
MGKERLISGTCLIRSTDDGSPKSRRRKEYLSLLRAGKEYGYLLIQLLVCGGDNVLWYTSKRPRESKRTRFVAEREQCHLKDPQCHRYLTTAITAPLIRSTRGKEDMNVGRDVDYTEGKDGPG